MLFMMTGGTLLIFQRSRSTCILCLKHCACETLWAGYRQQFLPNQFQTSHVSCGWWEEGPYWFWVTGSNVKVNFCTLCLRPCGHDSDYSFLPNHFQTSHVSCGWWEEEPYWFWVRGSKVKVNFGTLCIRPCGHNIDYSFAQSLSNFTCKLWMMRRGTLLILGHGVKGQGQLWHSMFKTLWAGYRLQFLLNHFQTSHVSCGWLEEEPYWFWFMGSKVKVNFAPPPCEGMPRFVLSSSFQNLSMLCLKV